jgi:hypothetical protein
MPTPEQRVGVLNPQARALLDLYPLPNFAGSGGYNYQVPIVGVTHGDNIQGNINNVTINAANRLSGSGGYQNTRTDDPDLFGFTDNLESSTVNGSVTWNRRITQTISAVIRYQFTQTSTDNRPYFANQIDVSGIAGISGNDRDPRNWGSARAELFERHRTSFNRNVLGGSEPLAHRLVQQYLDSRTARRHLWRRLPPTTIQSLLATRPTGKLHLHGRRDGK